MSAFSEVLICTIGGSTCALPLSAVIETMRPLPVEPVARALHGVLGMSIIRGEPTVVIDATSLLGQPPATPTRFVTLQTGPRIVALAVQAVRGVERLAAESVRDLPPLLRDADAIERLSARDTDLVFVLQAARLLPELS